MNGVDVGTSLPREFVAAIFGGTLFRESVLPASAVPVDVLNS